VNATGNTTNQSNNKEENVPVRSQPKRSMGMSPWDNFFRTRAGFDDVFAHDPFFAPLFRDGEDPFERMRRDIMMDWMPVLRSTRPKSLSSRLVRTSPGYEIKESEGAYEIALDIPDGLETKDLQVELERDGSVVHISGERQHSADGVESMTRFSKRFSIGDGVDAENIQANFADGCLVIHAPKLAMENQAKRLIPISNRPHKQITDEELRQKNYNDEFDESDWVETGKKAA
jgi:HSP20 family protein